MPPAKRATRWGLGVEHEFLLRAPAPAPEEQGGDGKASKKAQAEASLVRPGVRRMASKSGGSGLAPFSREAVWVPVGMPVLVLQYMRRRVKLPMSVTLDANVLPALELVTKDPHSRTVGAVARELRDTLAGIAGAVCAQDFVNFARDHAEAVIRRADGEEGEETAPWATWTAAKTRDALAATKSLCRRLQMPRREGRGAPPRGRARGAAGPPAPEDALQMEHGADVAAFLTRDGEEGEPSAAEALVYTGSLHVNVTLPHGPGEDTGPGSEFEERHRRAAACLQWLQPLLMVVLGSPHPFHSVDPAAFPAISFRHLAEPFSGMASTNVAEDGLSADRIVSYGEWLPRTGHYPAGASMLLGDRVAAAERRLREILSGDWGASSAPAWMRGMRESRSPADVAFVAQSYALCPGAAQPGADFRAPEGWERSGPFGFELRSLDRVPLEHLEAVLRLLWYAFDASEDLPRTPRILAGPRYNAWRSEAFLPFMRGAVRKGSAAPVTDEYAEALRRVFRVPAAALPGSATAHEALQAVADRLFQRFGGGAGPYSAFVDINASGEAYAEAPAVPDLNAAAMAYHAARNKADAPEKKAKGNAAKAKAKAKSKAKADKQKGK